MIANSRNRISYAPPIKRRAAEPEPPPPPAAQSSDWRGWLLRHFPAYTAAPMPEDGRHARLWEWFAGVDEARPRPVVHIWPRGGAKSTTVELGTAWVGQRLARRFGLYVSRTQTMADVHLQAIGTLLERLGIDRAVNKYNQSKGWTQQRLRASNGFNLVSFGMDAAMRGLKLDQYRPDLIIFDDIDDRHDSPAATEKKITTITESILPAGASNVAVVFIQNRIIDTGIAALLADGAADFLQFLLVVDRRDTLHEALGVFRGERIVAEVLQVAVHPADGRVLDLAPGVVGVLAAGTATTWVIEEPLRKVWLTAR